MGTEVKLAPELGPTVIAGSFVQVAPYAEQVFLEHSMLVVDNHPWVADLMLIRTALVKKRRAFKEAFNLKEPPKPVRKQLRGMVDEARALFRQLYPTFKSVEERSSFRPMITGPEPLHFDTYGGPNPMVTAYINVSNVPRVYGIGANFPQLVHLQPEAMRRMAKLAADRGDVDLSYVLRESEATPLGKDAPRHRVELAPGAIWFFNAKTVSHEVVYGEGTLGVSWEVPGCGAKMQSEIMKELA